MSHLSKVIGLSSICLTAALLAPRPLQADENLGASILFCDSGASLVGSLIQLDDAVENGSVEMSIPDLDKSSERLGMARPHIRSTATNTVIAPAKADSTNPARDALRFSRTALPLLFDTMPGVATNSFAQARPMVGPVVGVRPAYVRAASYR
jgi:hypothetical protein